MSKISDALSFMKKKGDVDMDVAETCNLIEFKEYHRNIHAEGGQEGNDSEEDDDGRGGAQRVKCSQQ